MKKFDKLWTILKGFTSTINRFPITILLFLIAAIYTSYNINANYYTNNYGEIILALSLGASMYMLLQMVYERFCQGIKFRWIFSGVSIIAVVIYILLVELIVERFGAEHVLRTIVLLFVIFIGFIWVPVIKSKLGFSESFMVIFKSFFMVLLYSLVLFLGISLTIMAVNMLIVDVDGRAYSHVASFIGFVYAPIHFLSLIPIYPKRDEEPTLHVNRAIKPTRLLEGLISYIVIPITAIFTVILLLYIVINITGDFWKDNLMEPLLVTYSITVIIVYLLASVTHNKVTYYFRLIFPKVLIPVVLFQTISSILKIWELGITSGRYYVIMFGIFATISAVIFSSKPNKKSNVIAAILIALSLVSIIPPVDAFTISKRNQIGRLTNILEKYDMLKDDRIVPNANLAKEDQQIIISSVRYLNSMDYLKDISWLKTYAETYDFERTFGFYQYSNDTKIPEIWRLFLADRTPIDVSDYDIFVEADLGGYNPSIETISFGSNGYSMEHEPKDGIGDLIIRDDKNNELLRYSLDTIFDRFRDEGIGRHGEMSKEEAEFFAENDNAAIYIIVQSLNLEVGENSEYQNINAYIMVKLK